ncbi:MAG: type I-E CRISPR-associated protein Cas5/CasD [Hyphomicrobium sp.]|nr:type I-E CRISPR-associated protein Cas5/CasD [Hyphomicrobium sp.]
MQRSGRRAPPQARRSTRRWLVVRLEAPLVAFGGVIIDHIGVTFDFPALSALTGLFANALGYDRTERQAHQDLQDRLIFAARREREPIIGVLRDIQNVQFSSVA